MENTLASFTITSMLMVCDNLCIKIDFIDNVVNEIKMIIIILRYYFGLCIFGSSSFWSLHFQTVPFGFCTFNFDSFGSCTLKKWLFLSSKDEIKWKWRDKNDHILKV